MYYLVIHKRNIPTMAKTNKKQD